EKKPKGILKNSTDKLPANAQKPKNNAPVIFSHHNEEVVRKNINPVTCEGEVIDEKTESTSQDANIDPSLTQPIPEGFFDDPILDAKVNQK
ncbi:jg4725, partial [Pararge aegeria aegeria]